MAVISKEILNESHLFRNGVTDFDWNPLNSWSMLSSSDNCDENSSGGGSIHAFRPIDLAYLPEDDAMARLQKYV
jgi:hypothetical protein